MNHLRHSLAELQCCTTLLSEIKMVTHAQNRDVLHVLPFLGTCILLSVNVGISPNKD